jgi:hypothetical protein
MELTPYVESLRRELTTGAEVGGDDARALAARLLPPLDAAVRLTLLESLSAAAEEISAELRVRISGGHIELAFAGRAELDACCRRY